jgi:hypothetical protein
MERERKDRNRQNGWRNVERKRDRLWLSLSLTLSLCLSLSDSAISPLLSLCLSLSISLPSFAFTFCHSFVFVNPLNGGLVISGTFELSAHLCCKVSSCLQNKFGFKQKFLRWFTTEITYCYISKAMSWLYFGLDVLPD